eukprot:TRINITY_DN420_c0_g3_i1.p1 TRINITY_DN420_c0_g3~~TRINITY_DN420_c0_g3_i1.p1  ORF type:complete len:145 (+),score=63.51 TRINITY_DN420_c0_g3_i1:48-482(+)
MSATEEPLVAAPIGDETGECGFLLHDFVKKFYEGKDAVLVSFRVLMREKFLWIWLGDAPLLTNSSVHVSTKDPVPSSVRLVDGGQGDFGVSLGVRLTKKLPNYVTHVNHHLSPERIADITLTRMIEGTIVKELRDLGLLEAKRP